jgi:S-(hydroxymethyl)glutathione dehydrogenase/alcohol dehydrogenase
MKTVAAVLEQVDCPLVIAELDLPELKPGQVLVQVAFSGVCHTQLLECGGLRGDPLRLPCCLGHEASGVVRDVGPGVTKCRPGDHVVLSWIKGSGAEVAGTEYEWGGRTVYAGSVTTFARHTIVSENCVTVIPRDFDLRDAAQLGCAVLTGVGAVFRAVEVRPGQSVVVLGTGGIGLCAVAGASVAGGSPIVAVDRSAERLAVAKQMGATHTICVRQQDVVTELAQLCPGGADLAVEASARPEVISLAIKIIRPRGGAVVVISNYHASASVLIDPRELNSGKRLVGTWGGDSVPDNDVPRYCQLIRAGRLDLRPLRARPFGLHQINDALEALEHARVARPLIDLSFE